MDLESQKISFVESLEALSEGLDDPREWEDELNNLVLLVEDNLISAANEDERATLEAVKAKAIKSLALLGVINLLENELQVTVDDIIEAAEPLIPYLIP